MVVDIIWYCNILSCNNVEVIVEVIINDYSDSGDGWSAGSKGFHSR